MKTLNEILEIVCDQVGVNVYDVLSKKWNKHTSMAKKIFIYMSRLNTDATYPNLAEFLHMSKSSKTDLLDYNNEIKTWLRLYPEFRIICDEIEYKIIKRS